MVSAKNKGVTKAGLNRNVLSHKKRSLGDRVVGFSGVTKNLGYFLPSLFFLWPPFHLTHPYNMAANSNKFPHSYPVGEKEGKLFPRS